MTLYSEIGEAPFPFLEIGHAHGTEQVIILIQAEEQWAHSWSKF